MLHALILIMATTAFSVAGHIDKIDSMESEVGPIVYMGMAVDSSDYGIVTSDKPTHYRNTATNKDTIIVDVDTTQIFYVPRILVVGFYTTYRNKKSILLEGGEMVTTTNDLYESITKRCGDYKLVNSAESKCLVYVDEIPPHTDVVHDVMATAHHAFMAATGCNGNTGCYIYPLVSSK